jgi:DNA-binding SARP family transcriptional activator/tetratricopeptide (TPR) repeat protein
MGRTEGPARGDAHIQGGVEFKLLGPLEIWIDGRRRHVGGARQERLLAVLLLNPGVLTTSTLVDVLWGDEPPDTARRQIHNAIAALRRRLGPAGTVIVTDGPGYRADVPGERADVRVDVHRFARAVDTARSLAASGDRAAATRTLSAGLALWRGPALAGLTGRAVESAAAQLDEQRLAARELLAGFRLEEGAADGLIPELTELVAEHPFRENLVGRLMLALYRAGRQSDALAVYEDTRTRLAEELGVDPGPELRQLHERVLRADPELRAGTPDPDDAGEPDSTTEQRCALPYDIADFTGRSTEIDRLLGMASSGTETAVVITALDGMAGIGKTTLAIRAAHLLAAEHPDGQLFVDLHGHTPGQRPVDPVRALDLLLRSVGVPPERIPDGVESRAARWRAELAGRRVLVVLDNAEDSAQVRALLPGHPSVRVLVTSRRRLSTLEGAASFSLDVMPAGDAADLFRRVAGRERTEPEPDQVHEVVRLCGYLPLAIRIAASRLRHRPIWSVEHLAERLRDSRRRLAELSTSDRGVLAAFSVSYRHLTGSQRRMFRALGLHPGPDFDACAAAALAGIPVAEAEQRLEELLDVHLLTQHTLGRYHFHDLLRAHARTMAEQEDSPAEHRAAIGRLAGYYLALGRAGELLIDPGRQLPDLDLDHPAELPELRTPWDVRALVAAEHLGFAAVMDAAAAYGLGRRAWQLPVILGPLLQRHGYGDEALAGYDRGLAAAAEAADAEGEAVLHRALGVAYLGAGRFADALDALRTSLGIEECRGDELGAGRVLCNLGIAHIRLGRYGEALEHLGRAMDLLRRKGTRHDQAFVQTNLGVAHGKLGHYPEAAGYHLSALAIHTELGNRFSELISLVNVGWTHTLAGRLDSAHEHLSRALALSGQLGAKEGEARARYLLADCLRRMGRPEEALRQCRAGLILAREINSRDIETESLTILGHVHYALGDLDAAFGCYQSTLRLIDDSGQTFKAAMAHDGLGKIALSRGDPGAARAHWTTALAEATAARLPEADRIRGQLDTVRVGH